MGSAHAHFRVLFLHQAVSAFPFLFCHRPQSQSSFAHFHFPSVSEPSVTRWSRHPIPSRQAYCSPRFEASPLPELDLASRTLAESRACGWNGQSEVRRSLNFSQEGAPLQFLRQFVALFCKLGRQNRLKTGVCVPAESSKAQAGVTQDGIARGRYCAGSLNDAAEHISGTSW